MYFFFFFFKLSIILTYSTLQCTFTFIQNVILGRIQGSRQTWWRRILVNIQGERWCTITIWSWNSLNIQNISVSYSPHVSETVSLVHGLPLAPCFWEGIRPDEYLLMFFRVYSSVRGRILAPCIWEGIRPWTNTCPLFLRGYSSGGRIVGPCFWEGIRPSTNLCLTNRTRSHRMRIPIRIRTRAGCAGLGEERRTPRATYRPLGYGSTWYPRGRHLHSLA